MVSPAPTGFGSTPGQRHEVDVVDRHAAAVARVAVDEVDQRVADALDRRNRELHRAGMRLDAPGAVGHARAVGVRRIPDAERDRADRRPVHARERLREARRFRVDDEVDARPGGRAARSCCGASRPHVKPICSNSRPSAAGSGAAYSMNSKPSVRSGLSQRSVVRSSAMVVCPCKGSVRRVGINARRWPTAATARASRTARAATPPRCRARRARPPCRAPSRRAAAPRAPRRARGRSRRS